MVLATELGMRPLVAHCHLGLGKLYRRTGKREPAREHVRSKPSSWFPSRLVLAESGTKTVRYQLVAERQSEMIEAMFMRLALALKLEREMNGLLLPEIRKSFSELNRMLMDH